MDLHITATHLLDGSFSPTGGAIVLPRGRAARVARNSQKLASRDPKCSADRQQLPGTERDRRRMVEAVRLARAIARNPVLAPFTAGEMPARRCRRR